MRKKSIIKLAIIGLLTLSLSGTAYATSNDLASQIQLTSVSPSANTMPTNSNLDDQTKEK